MVSVLQLVSLKPANLLQSELCVYVSPDMLWLHDRFFGPHI